MPDRPTLREIAQVAALRNQRQFSGDWRADALRLQGQGMSRDQARRVAELQHRLHKERHPEPATMLDATDPLGLAMEALLTPQKMLIAPVAALSQGAGLGTALGEMVEAPFTKNRTFGEIPGLREKAGVLGTLALDVFADPLFMVGGGLKKTGKVGKALLSLERARVQVSAGDVLLRGTKTPVTMIREILQNPKGVILKNRSPAATKKWIDNIRDAYGKFGEVWTKKGLGEIPAIDHVFVGPGTGTSLQKVPTAGDLIRQGSAGMFTVKVPFAPEVTRFAPAQALQARIADKLEGTAAGTALGLNRQARFLREVSSAAKAQVTAAQMQTQVLLDEMRRELTALGVDPKDHAILDRAQHHITSRGILEAGGQERVLAQRHADPSRLAEIHEMLYKSIQTGRSRSPVHQRWSQKLIKKLGVLVEENPEVVKAQKAGLRLDEPAVVAVHVDPNVAPALDLDKMNRWGKESRLHRFRQLYERTVDPVTGKGDIRKAYQNLQADIRGGIRKLVAEVYGLAKNDPILKVADSLEGTFQQLGFSELTTGTLATFGVGYFPRATSPFAEHLIQKRLVQIGKEKLHGKSAETIRDFNTFLEASQHRGFAHLTQMQVEEAFRMGDLSDLVGAGEVNKHFARFAEQVGADTNPGIASFMDLMSGYSGKMSSVDRSFLRDLVRTDATAANFYLSDPFAMAARRWGQGTAKIKAQEYTKAILDALGIEHVTQGATQSMDDFFRQVGRTVDEYDRPELYRAVVDTKRLPDEAMAELRALGAEIHAGGFATLPARSSHIAGIASGVTKPRRWKLHATVMTAEQADMLAKAAGRFSAPDQLQGFWREIERMTQFWKQWALFPRPAYHYRNFVSNTWLMYQAGMDLKDIGTYYLKAARLGSMATGKEATLGLKGAGEMFTRGELAGIRGGVEDFYKPGFLKHPTLGDLSAEQVHLDRINTGVFDTGFMQSENARALIQTLKDTEYKRATPWWKPGRLFNMGQRGTVMSAGQAAARQIEGLSRTALFLWGMEKKGLGRSDSAALVFEHLFNYNDLHKWERQLRSTFIPFWSWIRNNVPLQLRKLMEDPAKTLLPLKAVHSLRAQAQVADELMPDFIHELTGWPVRTFKDRNGREQMEIGFLGTNFPIADLVEVGKFAGTLVGVPMEAAGLFSRSQRVSLATKKTFRQGLSAAVSNLNPILVWPLEAAANISFFRMKELVPMPGGYVRIPWLGDTVVSPGMAHALAMIPFLREFAGTVFQTRDYHGNPTDVADRISRLVTGSPELFRQGPAGLLGLGGRMNVDVADAKVRALRHEEEGMRREAGYVKHLASMGRAGITDFDRFREILQIRAKRMQSAAKATTGRL